MKGCLNSITAFTGVFGNLNNKKSYEMLENLLPHLYKETDHIYYTTQDNFRRGTPVFEGLKDILSTFARDTGLMIKEVKFTSEPDILYYRLFYKKNNIGIIFVRNSGTEVKTGVYFQGVIESSKLLEDLKSRVLE
jgi:phosphomannomutase